MCPRARAPLASLHPPSSFRACTEAGSEFTSGGTAGVRRHITRYYII